MDWALLIAGLAVGGGLFGIGAALNNVALVLHQWLNNEKEINS